MTYSSIPLLLVLIVTNAGGEGKSALARLIAALLRLNDEPVHLLDGDIGNWTTKLREHDATAMGWGVSAGMAKPMLDAYSGRHLIIDTGANTFASMSEVVTLFPKLAEVFSAAGYNPIALLPLSTNKDGASVALQDLSSKIVGYDQRFVQVNRDGSNEYDGPLSGNPIIELSHLAPGFTAMLRQQAMTLDELVRDPPRDYDLAARCINEWMYKFASQPGVEAFLTAEPGKVLRDLLRGPAPNLAYRISTAEMTTDAVLLHYEKEGSWSKWINGYPRTADGLRTAAADLERRS